MGKKESSYDNLYMQQINEAMGAQPEYDNKKQEEKKRIKAENAAAIRSIRALGGFFFVAFLGAAAYLINLDPANAGPCAAAFFAFLVMGTIVYFMNK